ncbi:hypothetical protein N4J10_003975 [Escherichia coli]|uniref:hypothetical protein n=1 Tax=Enterobacteriaceae TaxID=543 RepID=UPI0028138849|nr:hypothetical protein [Klebsiella aerogenes]EJU2259354.1 hypothetical protein [Escherichia coli]MDQ9492145.1 hypothetical protein [Klebsiella aerogenes]HCB3422891.1 hypothetical protein [Escherichia coli]HEG2089466.1 hypothetical protein [Escherichia coli]
MNTYKLSHHYSRLHGFYGVKTEFDLHQLNLASAYLQLIRHDLPLVEGAEDTIGADNGAALLSAIYGMDMLTAESPYIAELDFYDNWNEYCGVKLYSIEAELLNISMPNVYQAVILSMINDCQESLTRIYSRDLSDESTVRINAITENLKRLTALARGEAVDPSWGWRSIENSNLAGCVYVSNDGSKDIPYFLRK